MPVSFEEYMSSQARLPRDEQVLIGRLELLDDFDRQLVDAVVIRGQPTASLARLMGKSQRIIRDRVLSLMRRVASDDFLAAARSLPYLTGEERRIATRYFCQAATLRQLSQETGMTIHRTRRRIDQLRAKINVISAIGAARISGDQWRSVQSAVENAAADDE